MLESFNTCVPRCGRIWQCAAFLHQLSYCVYFVPHFSQFLVFFLSFNCLKLHSSTVLKFCLVFLSARFDALWRKYVCCCHEVNVNESTIHIPEGAFKQKHTENKVMYWSADENVVRLAGTYPCIFPRSSGWCSITQWSQPLYRTQLLQMTRVNYASFCHLLRRRIMGATVWWGWDESHQALTSLFMLYGLLSSTGFVLKMSWGESCCLVVDSIPWEPLACLGSIWGTVPYPLTGS